MARTQHSIPRLQLCAGEDVAHVAGWGVVDGLVLQPGDRLLLGPVTDRALAILQPRGWGEIALGRRWLEPQGEQIRLEPGGMLASPVRWAAIAGVLAVERPLASGILGLGRWFLPHRRGQDGLGPLQLEQLLRQQRTAHPPGGVVVGRSVRAAEHLAPRPGWVRYVLLPLQAELIPGPWAPALRPVAEVRRHGLSG